MKKLFGWIFQGIAFLMMSAAFAVPTATLAFYFSVKSGNATPEVSNLVMSVLLSMIVVFVASRVPIRKNRALWACVFGVLLYAVLAYFVLFGFARGTMSILTPMKGEVPNDVLTYVGLAVYLFAVLLGSQGRRLVREANAPKKPRAPKIKAGEKEIAPKASAGEVKPQFVVAQPVVPVQQIPVVPVQSLSAQPIAVTPTYTDTREPVPVQYVKDKHGNLIARQNLQGDELDEA